MSELIEQHEAIIRDLTQKLQKAESRRGKLAAERSALGYSVHVTGDESSRKALDTKNMEAASLEGELLSLGGALDVLNQNLASAKAAENRAADETKAKALLVIADEFDEQVGKLAGARDAFVAACTALPALHTKAYSLGAQRPIRKQLDIMLARVIVTALMHAGLQQQTGVEFLAPSDRKSADALRQYADLIRTDALVRLGEEQPETPSPPATQAAAKPPAPPVKTSGADQANKALPPRKWLKDGVVLDRNNNPAMPPRAWIKEQVA